jgi:Na+/H+-dicarboxylate symporter
MFLSSELARYDAKPGPGLDASLIAIILGVDRIHDMCRTTLNVVGD